MKYTIKEIRELIKRPPKGRNSAETLLIESEHRRRVTSTVVEIASELCDEVERLNSVVTCDSCGKPRTRGLCSGYCDRDD